jgi:uncharacterized protein YjaZ
MRYAVEPYWNDWAGGQFLEEMIKPQFQKPILDLDGLEEEVKLLASSGIEEQIAETFAKLSAIIPKVEDTVVCIYALAPHRTMVRDRQNGVLGTGVGDNILLEINPLALDWERYVPWVLAHEYHHTAWGYHWYYLKGYRGGNLLTDMITNGEADSFGKHICPDLTPRWVDTLGSEEELKQWQVIRERLQSTDRQDLIGFMFGNQERGIPWCTGYTIGYHIVQSYLRSHPNVTMIELLETDPEIVFRESGYDGRP